MTPDYLTLSYHEIEEAVQKIGRARHAGRPIVPLIGGGISAESGIPTIFSLVRYFAAFRYYVDQGCYLPENWLLLKEHPLSGRQIDYRASRTDYVDDFGWPDPCQLRQSLRRVLLKPDNLDAVNVDGLDGGQGMPAAVKQADIFDAVIVDELDRLAKELYPDKAYLLEQTARQPGSGRRSWLWDVVGDWKELLRHVTGFNPDYAELLFARFHRARRPGLSHRFLAFLTNVLDIRLFLTITIDGLLEEALSAEGIAHRVFSLHPARPFPPKQVLRDTVSVIKLHGDASNLLADDLGGSPWMRGSLHRLKMAFPRDPLLLVLGCSGEGHRVMELVETMLDSREAEHDSPLRVIWLHYEEQRPRPLQRLFARRPGIEANCFTAGVKQPGLFLRHLYNALTSQYPASAIPYDTHSKQPTSLRRAAMTETDAQPNSGVNGGQRMTGTGNDLTSVTNQVLTRRENETKTVFLFDSLPSPNQSQAPLLSVLAPSASESLTEWMNDQAAEAELLPICIDLEGHYTLPEVVGTIIDRCRLHDAQLAPSVLPLNPPPVGEGARDEALDKAVDRVVEALQRGRYVLAFDGLEAFMSPQTVHHGITRKILADGETATSELRRLIRFLINVSKKVKDTARIGVSVHPPQRRHGDTDITLLDVIQKQVDLLIENCGLVRSTALAPFTRDEDEPNTSLGASWDVQDPPRLKGILVPQKPDQDNQFVTCANAALALLCLCCFRRTRSLTALRSLLAALVTNAPALEGFGPFAEVDHLVAWYCRKGFLIPLEGALYSMPGRFRDTIYSANSSLTETSRFIELLTTGNLDRPGETAAQLLLLALHHDRIARYYYFDTFLISRDAQEFFEYAYHRVSSIRYLTKLHLVLEHSRGKKEQDLLEWSRKMIEVMQTNTRLGEGDDSLAGLTLSKIQAFDDLCEAVRSRRLREIASLRLAWNLSRDVLQNQVPAEQLIGWCEWIIKDDLPRFETRRYLPEQPHSSIPESDKLLRDWRARCRDLDKAMLGGIAELRNDLYELCARSRLERTDYLGSVVVRADQLGAWASTPGCGQLEGLTEQFKAEVEAGQINWETVGRRFLAPQVEPEVYKRVVAFLLDVAECGVGRGDNVSDLLQSLKNKIYSTSDPIGFLRHRWLVAENHLNHVASLQATAAGDRLVRAKQAVAEALIALRPIGSEGNVGTGQPYFHYRSLFLLTRGKAEWMAKETEAFKRAYQDFELARGRTEGAVDRTFLAEIDLHVAECALAHADWLLGGAAMRQAEALRQAEARYRSALGCLRHAYDHLLRGRRNVVWWKQFAFLYCTYKSNRNLLRLAQLVAGPDVNTAPRRRSEWPAWVKEQCRSFVRTLRQGLETLHRGLDVELDPRAHTWHQLGLELLLTGLCFGKEALKVLRKEPENLAETLVPYGHWLSDTFRLAHHFQVLLADGEATRVKVNKTVDDLLAERNPLELRKMVREKARQMTDTQSAR
jgi:SIR2-like domain